MTSAVLARTEREQNGDRLESRHIDYEVVKTREWNVIIIPCDNIFFSDYISNWILCGKRE